MAASVDLQVLECLLPLLLDQQLMHQDTAVAMLRTCLPTGTADSLRTLEQPFVSIPIRQKENPWNCSTGFYFCWVRGRVEGAEKELF